MAGTEEATTAITIIGIIIILLLETATLITTIIPGRIPRVILTTTTGITIQEEITGAGIIIMETMDRTTVTTDTV